MGHLHPRRTHPSAGRDAAQLLQRRLPVRRVHRRRSRKLPADPTRSNDYDQRGYIPDVGFEINRGWKDGNRIILVGKNPNQSAIIDVSNPDAPLIVRRLTLQAEPKAVQTLSRLAAIANTTDGLALATLSDPPTLDTFITLPAGPAVDVALLPGYAFVADEAGFAIINIAMPPIIRAERITFHWNAPDATVTGTAGAIASTATPLTAELRNAASGAIVPFTINADGSFSATIAAAPGETVILTATDALGRTSDPLPVGTAPFGEATIVPFTPDMTGVESDFEARNIVLSGNRLFVTSDYAATSRSYFSPAVEFDISNPSQPVFVRAHGETAAGDLLYGASDLLVHRNALYAFAADGLFALDLATPNAQITKPLGSNAQSVAGIALGDYLVTSPYYGDDGGLQLWDVTEPLHPRFVRDYSGFGTKQFTGFALLGGDYLVAVEPEQENGGTGRDVVLIDRRDPTALRVVSRLEIPNFDARRVFAAGTTLYVHESGGRVAVVDASNPSAPVLLRILQGYGANGFASVPNTSQLAMAGGDGLALLDITVPGNPAVIGAQSVGGRPGISPGRPTPTTWPPRRASPSSRLHRRAGDRPQPHHRARTRLRQRARSRPGRRRLGQRSARRRDPQRQQRHRGRSHRRRGRFVHHLHYRHGGRLTHHHRDRSGRPSRRAGRSRPGSRRGRVVHRHHRRDGGSGLRPEADDRQREPPDRHRRSRRVFLRSRSRRSVRHDRSGRRCTPGPSVSGTAVHAISSPGTATCSPSAGARWRRRCRDAAEDR